MDYRKFLYAAVGAPVAAGKTAAEMFRKAFAESAAEGRKTVERISGAEDELNLDQLQERVGQLKDQVEGLLSNWRDSFQPEKVTKPAAKKAPAKSTAKKAPAKSTAKKAPAKSTAKKAPAKKAPAKSTAKKEKVEVN